MHLKLIAALLAALAVAPATGAAAPAASQISDSCREYRADRDDLHVSASCRAAARAADILVKDLTGVDCPVLSRGQCDEDAEQARREAFAALAPHICGDHPGFTVRCDETRSDLVGAWRLAMGAAFAPARKFHERFCAGVDPTGTVETSCA
ncbi:MAG TPA: hypothetical protein VM841_15055 [Actinomycetota bacterium]|nr:hypothetical protein [Actinomycetota bacterium]